MVCLEKKEIKNLPYKSFINVSFPLIERFSPTCRIEFCYMCIMYFMLCFEGLHSNSFDFEDNSYPTLRTSPVKPLTKQPHPSSEWFIHKGNVSMKLNDGYLRF